MNMPESMVELARDLDDTQAYVRDYVTERTDSSSFEELVAMEHAVTGVKKACEEALSLIRTEQLKQLEAGSREVGSQLFARVPDGKVRFSHGDIAKRVRDIAKSEAVDRETGEILPDRLGEMVAKMIMDLYVSPSTKAKTTVLDKLDIPYKEVSKFERTGHKIKIVDLEIEDE
jgi:hypothetical protein